MSEYSTKDRPDKKSLQKTSIQDVAPFLTEVSPEIEAPVHAGASTVGLLQERFGNQAMLDLMQGAPSDEFGAHLSLAFHMGLAGMDASHAVPGGADSSAVMAMREALSSDRRGGFDLPSSSSSEALPASIRERLEQAFGRDLGHVRIHRDASAARSSADVGAHAFAIGPDIWFGQGEWRPDTEAGVELIAHEVTHVLQADDNRLPSANGPGLQVSQASDPHEREAVARAQEVAAAVSELKAQESGVKGISDADGERAMQTQLLAERLGARLGLSVANVQIRVDDEAARITASRGTSALLKDGAIYVRPDGFDPSQKSGQFALAHEMTHLAQLGLDGSDAELGPEAEANAFASAFVMGGATNAPVAGLSVGSEASLDGQDKPPLTLPPEKAQAPAPEKGDPPNKFENLSPGSPHKLSNAVLGDFQKAADLIKSLSGVDIMVDPGDSIRNLGNATAKVGADNFSWHKTGRAIDLNQDIAWYIVQQDQGGSTFFRLYLLSTEPVEKKEAGGDPKKSTDKKATDKKTDTKSPNADPGPNTLTDQSQAPTSQAAGTTVAPEPSSYLVTLPKGTKFHYPKKVDAKTLEKKFVDVTAILEAYGFTRIKAQDGWEDTYNRREWWHYNKLEGKTWYEAVREVYSEEDFVSEMKRLSKTVGEEKSKKRLLAEGTPQDVIDKIFPSVAPKKKSKKSA